MAIGATEDTEVIGITKGRRYKNTLFFSFILLFSVQKSLPLLQYFLALSYNL